MEVSTRADGFRKYDAGGVDGLEDTKLVASSGDFLDQDRGQSFRAKLLVDA